MSVIAIPSILSSHTIVTNDTSIKTTSAPSRANLSTCFVSANLFFHIWTFFKPREQAYLTRINRLSCQQNAQFIAAFWDKLQTEKVRSKKEIFLVTSIEIRDYQKKQAELLGLPVGSKEALRKKRQLENLRERIEEPRPVIYIKYATDLWKPVRFEMELGCGGSKRAIEIENGKALLIPNMDFSLKNVYSWSRICHEEVAVSNLCTRLGLLSPQSIKVDIALSNRCLEGVFPAYVSNTFSSFGQRDEQGLAHTGIFILDKKNSESSTWTRKDKIFKTREIRVSEGAHWDHFFSPLIDDIVTVCKQGISIYRDSRNIAIVNKKDVGESVSRWQARMFIFDITDRAFPIDISKLSRDSISFTNDKERDDAKFKANSLITDYVGIIFREEFEGVDFFNSEVTSLKQRLVSRYNEMIEKRLIETCS